MKRTVAQLLGGILATVMTLSMMASPAAASDVDLGPVQTVEELVASPEYRAWHADVLRLYRAFFDRQPDTGGAAYWIGIYEDGASLDDLAWNFSNSAEFKATYGGSLSNAEFLTIVYSNVLGREPDPGGYAYWLDQMNKGLSQPGVVRWVVANEEFKTSYPYTATATALAAYLLTPSEVAGLDEVYEVVKSTPPYPPVNATGCSSYRSWPKNVEFAGFGINNNASLYQLVYEFSTVAAAEAFMDKAAQVPAGCNPMNWGTLLMNVVPVTAPDLGDESVANYFYDSQQRTGKLHWKEIYVRTGRIVYFVDVSTLIGTSADTVYGYAAAAQAHIDAMAG